MWIGQGLLVFLVKCVRSVMFSNWIQWPNSEVHAFLTLVLRAGYFAATSNTKPQPPVWHLKESKKAQKDIR